MRRALAALLLAPALVAQGLTSGSLRGVVRSADGTPLAGARLDLEEVRTGRHHPGVSGADGAFRFIGLEPGPCRLTVRAAGFAGQRLAGLEIRAGSDLDLPVELIPMESDLVLDMEAPAALGSGEGGQGTRLSAALLRALPLRTRSLAELGDLGPWPAPPASALRVDGLDLGASGTALWPLGPEALSEARILSGGADAEQPGEEALLASTRGGGNAFGGEAQTLWGPASGAASDRQSTVLAASGPLRTDQLFVALTADREAPGEGSATTRGALRVDWLPTGTQQATLRVLDAAAGPDRDQSLALSHRWAPGTGFVQETRLQLRRVEASASGPARVWEAGETLGLALGAHDLQAGGDLQQLRSEAQPGAAGRRTGLFLQDAWRLAPPFTLRLGLRNDREALTGGGAQGGTSPRLAFTWHLTDRLSLTGSHGRFLDPAPLVALGAPPSTWGDRRESRLGLAFRPLPDLALTAEARAAEGRLWPGGGDRDRLRGGTLGARWQVGAVLAFATSWTLVRTHLALPGGLQDGTLRRLRLWAVWDTRDLASPWARDWTLALVGRLQSGAEAPWPGTPPAAPSGAPVLDLRLARTLGGRRLRVAALLDAFDLLDRTRPPVGGTATVEAGRRIQIGLRGTF
jgi:hypothetical protein